MKDLVLDTSALINLHASTRGAEIIRALPRRVVVAEVVAEELNRETGRMSGQSDFLGELAGEGALDLLVMTDDESEHFWKLTSGDKSLDDGEAATIAIAASRCLIPVIDERKGRSQASALSSISEIWWSLDLFRHPSVVDALAEPLANQTLFLALFNGRMRVPVEQADSVISLIGIERARQCICLPNFRQRFGG